MADAVIAVTYFPNGAVGSPQSHAVVSFAPGSSPAQQEFAEMYDACLSLPTAPIGSVAQLVRDNPAAGAAVTLSAAGNSANGGAAKLYGRARAASGAAGTPNHEVFAK
jgi:hypothetical protein